jgi:hypothetical protein
MEESGGDGSDGTPDYTRSACYGSERATEVYDPDTHMPRPITATCRAEGERTLVYVADEIWEVSPEPGAPAITQSEVNAFMVGYELDGRASSYDPELGVLPADELVFGALRPDGLSDGKLPVFVVDSGGLGEGYLCSWCPELEFHLDGPLLRSLHTDKTLSIAAHETFHAIHRGYDASETVWVDETLAQAAMTVNGFFTDGDWLDAFLENTNVAWGPSHDDPIRYQYGAGLLFGTYLWEQGGRSLLRAITGEPLDDWEGIDAALATTGNSSDAYAMYLDMALATFLDDPSTGFSFESFDLAGSVVPTIVGTGSSYTAVIQPYGLVFMVFDTDARGLTLDMATNVSARLVLDGRPTEVLELAPGESVDFDTTPRVLLLTARQSSTTSVSVR